MQYLIYYFFFHIIKYINASDKQMNSIMNIVGSEIFKEYFNYEVLEGQY